MSQQEIDSYLQQKSVPHQWIHHSPAFTAQEVAASAHVRGKDFAKTVIVRLNGKMAMTVLPAHEKISPNRLRQMVGVKELELVSEEEFAKLFPDCEPGAMPPFGTKYGMPVFVADTLAKEHDIAFNAGSHTDCLRISYSDFVKLEHPRVGSFTTVM